MLLLLLRLLLYPAFPMIVDCVRLCGRLLFVGSDGVLCCPGSICLKLERAADRRGNLVLVPRYRKQSPGMLEKLSSRDLYSDKRGAISLIGFSSKLRLEQLSDRSEVRQR